MPAFDNRIKLGLSTALSILASFTQTADADDFGLANLDGKILLPPVYADIRWTSKDCFRVTPKGDPRDVVPFFVNQNGEKIPTPPGAKFYDERFPLPPPSPVPSSIDPDLSFKELAQVQVPGAKMRENLGLGYYQFEKDGHFGICDQNGRTIFSPNGVGNGGDVRPVWTDRFLQDTFTPEGVRVYKLYDEKANFIADLPQEIVVRSREYHDDLLLVELAHGNRFGYVNRKGQYQIKPKYYGAEEFNEGFASVIINDHGTICGALIDKNEKLIAGPFQDGWTEHFENGLAIVTLSSKLCGMVDRSGEFVLKPEFESLKRDKNRIFGLKNGRLHVFSDQGQLLSVLPSGVRLEDPIGDDVWRFFRQEASVKNGDGDSTQRKYGVVDAYGQVLVEPKYDAIFGYSKNHIAVGTRNFATNELKVGLTGPDGKFVIPQKYDGVSLYGKNAILYNRRKGFDRYDWMPSRDGMIARMDLWREFLREQDVIGMRRTELYKFLGQPNYDGEGPERNQIKYYLSLTPVPHCGTSPEPILAIEFDEHDRVTGWRYGYGTDNLPWNRTNVVHVQQKDEWRLVPKTTAQSYK